MHQPDLSKLAPHYRLALAYAPERQRDVIWTLMLFDQRLAHTMKKGREPLITQMKLAWWRDRFSEDPAAWPDGEPMLGHLRLFGCDVARLQPMVDAWELLLADSLGESEMIAFARGRSAGWLLVSRIAGTTDTDARDAAELFALVDLSLNLSREEEARAAREIARRRADLRLPRSRALRPLAILAGLARRNLDRNAASLLDGPGALATAMRIGMTGR